MSSEYLVKSRIMEALKSRNADVRKEAVEALDEASDMELLLKIALDDEDAYVRQEARERYKFLEKMHKR